VARQWIKRVPIDLEDGETILSHSMQFLMSVSGKRKDRDGFFVITDRRVLFARAHYWTDALMQAIKKTRPWMLIDVPKTSVVGIEPAPDGMLKVKTYNLKLSDGGSARIMPQETATFATQVASLGFAL